jgi:hypothetical protein
VRLFADQLAYIVNHAGDRIIIVMGRSYRLLANASPL